MDQAEIMPGDRVSVFDHRLFKDDKSTPLSTTIKSATVIRRYGKEYPVSGKHPDLVDVEFDYLPGQISKAHFTRNVVTI